MIKQYRKKPVVIEAIQWLRNPDGNTEQVKQFLGDSLDYVTESDSQASIVIKTLEGTIKASPYDYIIKGVAGEFYPCKPDVFRATYEDVQ
jgi:hypothetical protein